MMYIALIRLRALWPDATIHVLTDDPNQLADFCPQIQPMLATGRHAWVQSGIVNSGVYRQLKDQFKIPFRILRRTLKGSSPPIARQDASREVRTVAGADSGDIARYLDAVRETDLFIVTGMGGITDAFPEYAFGLLKTLDLAIESGAMTAMVGQGIGPLERRDLITVAKRVLPKIDFISLRERLRGMPLLKRLGVDLKRVVVTGDDAIELANKHHPEAIGNHLGVNVRRATYSALNSTDMDRLRAPVHSIIQNLGCPVISVPVSRRAEESDSQSFADFLGSHADVTETVETITSPMRLINQIGRCRLVIAGSYHAAVFALSQGIPAIGLAGNAYYIQKFEGLADQFGLGCEIIRFNEKGFEEKLKSAAIRMWDMAEELRPRLLDRAAQQVSASKAAYEALSQKATSRFATTAEKA